MPLKSGAPLSQDEYWANVYGDNKPNNTIAPAIALQEPELEPEPEMGNFTRGLNYGLENMQALAGGAKALYGSQTDNPDMVDSGMEIYNRNMQEAEKYAGDIMAIEDIDYDLGKAGKWLAFTAGTVVPDITVGLATGFGGGMLMKKAAQEGVKSYINKEAKDTLQDTISKGIESDAKEFLAKELGEDMAKDQIASSALKGSLIGSAVPTAIQSSGGSFARILQDTGVESPLTATGVGIVSGALEALPFSRAFKSVFPAGNASKFKDFIASELAEKPAWAIAALKDMGEVGGIGFVTEGIQFFVDDLALTYVNNNFSENEAREYFDQLSNERKRSDLINQTATGGVAGLGLGAGAVAVKTVTGQYGRDTFSDQAGEERTKQNNDPERREQVKEFIRKYEAEARGEQTITQPTEADTESLNANEPLTPEQRQEAGLSELTDYDGTDMVIPEGTEPDAVAPEIVPVTEAPEQAMFAEDSLPPAPQAPPADIVTDFESAPAFGERAVPANSTESGTLYEYHNFEGQLSDPAKPVTDQLVELSVAANTPEALDSNNNDVVVEAIDVDDVDRIFDRNDSLKVETNDKPRGKSLPTVDESFGENSQEATNVVAGVVADLSASGVPKSFLDAVTGIYVHKESELDVPALTGSKSFGISINSSLVSGAVSDPKQLSELAWSMTHEVYHAADFSMGLSDKDPQFGITIVSERDQPTVVMGDVMDEIFTNWENKTELGKRFDYPFNDLQKEINDLDKENEGLDVKYRQEAFAQLGAMFHSNPKLLQEQSPLAYNFIKGIRDSNLKTNNVPEVQSEGTSSPSDPNATEPTGLRGQVRASPESGSVESTPVADTGSDGEGSTGVGRTDSAVEGQAQEEVGQRERSDLQKPEVDEPFSETLGTVTLKLSGKKPTFKKAENWEDTGTQIVTFPDGDRYQVYFDEDASQGRESGDDEIYYESIDGKIFDIDLGTTKQEALQAIIDHREKLVAEGRNSYNTPLDAEVGSDTYSKGYDLIVDSPEGKLKLTDLRKKFKKLDDNQFDNLVEKLLDSEPDGFGNPKEAEDVFEMDGDFIVNPETVKIIEEEGRFQDLMDDDPSFIKRESLSPAAQEITASGVLYGEESIDIVATGRNGSPVVVDLARAFDERVKKANDGEIFSSQDEATLETISDLIAHEAVEAMNTDGNAGEWYQEKVANAMRIASETFPELATEPDAKFAFTAIMAITSNGASVPENSVNTFDLYEKYRDTKIFPDFGVGKESQAMEKAFSLLNRLIEAEGVESVRKFMDIDITVKELVNNFGLTVSGELMGTRLKGSAILGPKIGGGFYQNLNGNFDPLTMDRWFMRTYGRLTGTLMAEADRKLPAQVDKFREVALGDDYRKKLKEDGISRLQLKKDDQYLVEYATKVQSSYANGGFKLKNSINKASNNLKNSQGEKQAPQNGKEREFIREVMTRALTKVNETSGMNSVNMGALQAIVWYPEKNLYKMLGVGNKKSEPTDYETEFQKITEARRQRGQDLSGSVGSAQQSGTGRLESADGADVSNTNPATSRQNRQEDSQSEIDAPPEEISYIKKKQNNAKNNTLDDGSPSTSQFSFKDEIDGQSDLRRRFNKGRNPTVRSLSDRYDNLKQFEDQAADYLEVGRIPASMSPRDQENLSHGKVQDDLNEFHKTYVDVIGDLIHKSGIDPESIGVYLLAKHAQERNANVFEKEKAQREKNIARTKKEIQKLEDDVEADHTVAIATQQERLSLYETMPFKFEDSGSGMTNGEAQSVLNTAEREGTKGQTEEIASKVYEMLQFQRDRMVKAGLLDEVSKADWEDTFKFYVPLKGFAAEENGDTYVRGSTSRGFSIVGSESMKAKGRKTLPVNPLLTAIEDVQKKIIRARKNETAQTLLDLLSNLGTSDSYVIYNNKFRPPMESDPLTMQDLKSMSRDRRPNGDPKYVEVKKGGQTFFIYFKSDSLNHSLQNMSVPLLSRANESIGKVLTFATRFQTFRRNMLINYNPSWGLVNPIRDVQTALMYGLSEMDKKGSRTKGKNIVGAMAKAYLPSMRSLYRYYREKPIREGNEIDQYTQEFHDDGAQTGLMLVRDQAEQLRILKSKLKKGYTRDSIRSLLKFVEDFNTTMENSVRLSSYIEARKAGAPREDAATLAKDLTVNFNRKGEDSATVNALYLFFNAAVQGNVNIMQALGNDGSSGKRFTTAQKTASGLVALGASLALMNILNSEDDDDGDKKYEDLPEHAKNRSLLIMGLDGEEGFALPAPYGYNFFTNMGRYGTELAMGVTEVKDVAVNLFDNILLNFVPITWSAGDNWAEKMRGFYPDLLELHQDLVANKDFFGSDIAVEQNPLFVKRSQAYVAKRGTGKNFKEIAKFMNDATGGDEFEDGLIWFSPDRMQYAYSYFFGGLGRSVSQSGDVMGLMAADEEVRKQDMPIISTFFKRPSEYADRFEYYDNWEEVRQMKTQITQTTDPKELEDLYKRFKPFVTLMAGESMPVLQGKGIPNLYDLANKDLIKIRKSRKLVENQNYGAGALGEEKRKQILDELDKNENLIFDIFNKAYRKAEKKAKG